MHFAMICLRYETPRGLGSSVKKKHMFELPAKIPTVVISLAI